MSLRDSSAVRHPLQGIAVNILILLSLVLLLYGLTMPILTLEKFVFFTNTVSLLSALQTLAAEAEWGLFILIGSFSVVFPLLKIAMLLLIWNLGSENSQRHQVHLRWLATYSKWSMLDVFVVALLVVSIKLGAVAQAHVETGIYAFAASVILSMAISNWMGHNRQ